MMKLKLKLLALTLLAALLCAAVPLAAATITPEDTMDTGPKLTADVTSPWGTVGKVHMKDVTLVYAGGQSYEQPTIITIDCKGVSPYGEYEGRWKVMGPDPTCPDCGPRTYDQALIPMQKSQCPLYLVSDDKGNIEATLWANPGTVKSIQEALTNPNSYLTVSVSPN